MAVEVNNTATQANADKRTYSVQEIADILQISRSMAYALCDSSCDCLHDARRRDWCLTMGSC